MNGRNSRISLSRELRTLFELGKVSDLGDGELLDRFLTSSRGNDDGPANLAFSALVDRHGPMVWRVCRRILGGGPDAEDAFQATFLVLARRAQSVRKRGSLSSWLHGVARRICLRSRSNEMRRRRHETSRTRLRIVSDETKAGPGESLDLAAILDDELGRLPERFRSPIILCDLEDLTHEEAARALGCPVGTVKSRLARGRERLRLRLIRRGLAPAVGAGFLAADSTAKALPPAALIRTTIGAVRQVSGMAIPASTSLLIARELTSMTVTKLGIAAMASAVLAAIGGGVYQFGGANAGQAPVARQAAAGQVTSEPKPEAKRPGDDWKRHERNLKRIGLALHNYHDAHGGFPTAAIMGRDGTPLLSWRVAILPYLSHADGAGDFGDLHRQFHLDEPWDSPHNRTLLAKMPDAFEAPGGKLGSFETPYRALTGPKTMFEGNRGITLRDVPDGPEKTLMVVEDRQAVPWTKTDEMSRATLLQRLGEINGEVFAALFASGHVRQLEYIGGGHSMGCRLAMEESRSLWIFSGRMSCLQMPGGGWGFPMTGLVEEAKVRTIRKRKI